MAEETEQKTVDTGLGRPPGKGTGKARRHLRGRQTDPTALAEVQAVLGPGQRRRDELIEYLHALQDQFGHLSTAHLAALAWDMRLPQAEVFEIATFYHAFDVVPDDAEAPGTVTVRVCDSLTCEVMGGRAVLDDLLSRYGTDVRILPAACMGRCDSAPVASVNRDYIGGATVDRVAAAIDGGLSADPAPESIGLAAYRQTGGYALLQDCSAGRRTMDGVIDALDAAGIRGLGGAGFPTGRKWRSVRAEPAPRLMAVNADESEPGTFKDRWYLERDPHRFIEGMLIAAWAIEAEAIYIYLRTEYPHLHGSLGKALDDVRAAGLFDLPVVIRRGAGAYICGEESAMLESLEGKRGLPRHKPPYPSQVGLFGRPTLINNVETLYWVRDAVTDPAPFLADGRHGHKGQRSFSVSGRVRSPGVKLAPAGITVRELIDDYCDGMQDGHSLAAFLPGGASGGVFPAKMADTPLDFGTFEPHGGFIGSAAIIVLSAQDPITDTVSNLLRFFKHESCGQCTPCRSGTEKAVALLERGDWDAEVLGDLATVMADASICGLGQAAASPLRCAFKYFPEDLP